MISVRRSCLPGVEGQGSRTCEVRGTRRRQVSVDSADAGANLRRRDGAACRAATRRERRCRQSSDDDASKTRCDTSDQVTTTACKCSRAVAATIGSHFWRIFLCNVARRAGHPIGSQSLRVWTCLPVEFQARCSHTHTHGRPISGRRGSGGTIGGIGVGWVVADADYG